MDTEKEKSVVTLVRQARQQSKGNFIVNSALNAQESVIVELLAENKRLREELTQSKQSVTA